MGSNKGFTIIEVLVSISIFLTVVTAPIALSSNVYKRVLLTEKEVTARLYSEEAIEYVRELKDGNILQFNKFLQGNGFDKCINTTCFLTIEKTITEDDYGFITGFTDTKPIDWNNIVNEDDELKDLASIKGCTNTINPDYIDDDEYIRVLKITLNRENSSIATVEACVIWKDRNGIVNTQKAREIIYEWLGV